MQEEVIITVMKELLEEEKQVNGTLNDVKLKLHKNSEEIKNFKDHVTQIKLIVPPIDTSSSESLLSDHLLKMNKEIERLKVYIIAERNQHTKKEVIMHYLGWILLSLVLMIALIILIKSNHH